MRRTPSELVATGLAAMCLAPDHEFNEKHWGAAMITAGLTARDPTWPEPARVAVAAQAERLIEAKAPWFERALPAGRPADPNRLVEALVAPPTSLHLLGHDTSSPPSHCAR